MKTPLNLGKVLRLGLVRLANGGVDVFLASDDNPGTALALRAQLLGDGLQAEHELRIGTDKLTHLIHQKDHLVVGRFGSKVVVDDLGKAFDVDAKVIAGTVKPLASRLGRHLESLGKRHHDVVTQEIHGVALLLPGAAVRCSKRSLEGIQRSLGNQMALHVGDMRSVARVAQLFVEDAQEHLQDGVAVGFAVCLGVDVEQDHISGALHGALNVGLQHGVFDLVVIEELGGAALFTGFGVLRL